MRRLALGRSRDVDLPGFLSLDELLDAQGTLAGVRRSPECRWNNRPRHCGKANEIPCAVTGSSRRKRRRSFRRRSTRLNCGGESTISAPIELAGWAREHANVHWRDFSGVSLYAAVQAVELDVALVGWSTNPPASGVRPAADRIVVRAVLLPWNGD